MPDSQQILDQLHAIANGAAGVAIAWHVAALLVLAAVLAGWRPTRRALALMTVLPLLSVAVMGWAYGNPFNGMAFVLLTVILAGLGLRIPAAPLPAAPVVCRAVGVLMVAFGLLYPHFLDAGTLLAYLHKAPLGLIPCPTLAAVIGIGLLADGLGSRAWSLTLVAGGLFYALFGVLRLGVWLDLGLLIGTAALAIRALTWPRDADPSRSGA